ncbi:MAG: hypothetical protein ABI613_07575 [Gemmatimonadota bacterium]
MFLLSFAVVAGMLTHPSTPSASGDLVPLARRYIADHSGGSLARAHTLIPAWARKYNVNCSACHRPAVPRLNEAGQRFKWAGYRMPEEIGENVEVAKIQNYLAAGGKVQYEWEKTSGAPTTSSQFALPGVTIFYAGPFGRNFSGFFELEHGSEGEIERIAQASMLWGKEERYAGFRVGQMHYLAEWGLAGFDRAIGISTPLPIEEPISGGVPFTLGEHQLGLEGFLVTGPNRLSAQILNGVDASGMGSLSDADTRKDFLVTDQILIDHAGSGVQGVAYYGTIVGLDPSATGLNTHFWRLGVTANKIFHNVELLGAVIYAQDKDLPVGGGSPFTTSDDKGLGFWLSGQYTFVRDSEPSLTVFGRFESNDPNTEVSDDKMRRMVVGAVLPINLPQYFRWAIEFRRDMPQGGLPKTSNITTELMLNF